MRELHQVAFRSLSSSPSKSVPTPSVEKQLNRKLSQFQGKIIRRIHIETLDPFGFSDTDTTQTPNKWEQFGNIFHNKTKPQVVEKQLLFHPNQPLDTFLIKETERVLRSQSYVRNAVAFVRPTHSPDSVDVTLRVLDSWSLLADADGSTHQVSGRLRERNFFGRGHRVGFRYRQEIPAPRRTGFELSYGIPNLFRTRINTEISYEVNFEKYYQKRWIVQRPYYSTLTRWAGGLEISEQTYNESILQKSTAQLVPTDFKTQMGDVWASVSFPIFKDSPRTNYASSLILSGRTRTLSFRKAPSAELDKVGFYSDQILYLGSLGVGSIGYEQDRYIFKAGDIEDVSVGKRISVLAGWEHRRGEKRSYFGMRALEGNYFSNGYLSYEVELGSYFLAGENQQSTLRVEINHFTPLLSFKNWKLRQFTKLRNVTGLNREAFIKDRITLNGSTGIYGFDSPYVNGTHKTILSSQTQFYSPFVWWGFHISPFILGDLAMIGSQPNLMKSRFFTKLGVGFYVTNDYVKFSQFQFSFFFLPNVPGRGSVQEFTGFENEDFGLPDFRFTAPKTIVYE